MKAEELRIGNWIADRGGKKWQIDFWECQDKVSAKAPLLGYYDDNKEIQMYGHPLTEYIDFLQPIPLTEEWLLKFGFEKVEKYDCYVIKFGILQKEFILNFDFIMMDIDLNVQLKSIHQLQNLYFALTGEELTIKTK